MPLQALVRDVTLHRGHAYRHGGEEFIVMLPNCGVDETMAFADKLRKRIEAEESAIRGGEQAGLTVSVGLAVWPLHEETCDDAVAAANSADHEAKNAGKNRVKMAPN